MPTISPTLPNDGETIDAQDVNGPFNAILGVLNGNVDQDNIKPGSLPWSVMDSFSDQIPASAMKDSGNLEKFRADAKISFIASGLVWSALTGLNGSMTLGQYYSNSGILLPITGITSYAFTASRDTYISIGQNGSIGYSVVNNNAAQPALPANSNWLAKVVTSASAVTSVTDMRQTAPIASHNIDFATLPISINSFAGITVTATSYTDIGLNTTATIRDSGKALVIISTYKMSNASAGAETWLSYSVSGASSIVSSNDRSIMIQSASANLPQIGGSFSGVITGLTPGSNTFNVQGKVSTGNGFFSTVTLTVIPL